MEKKITIKQYAVKCGISVQAAHKRLADKKGYPEIISVEKFARNLFFITINTRKGYTKNATTLQR